MGFVIRNNVLVNYTEEPGVVKVVIPDGVSEIGKSAFSNCDKIQSVTIPDSVVHIASIAFYNCTSLTDITIPDSVKTIGSGSFNGCTSLKSITIPDSVTSIDNNAFRNCTSLHTINIPDSLEKIGEGAFGDTPWLSNYKNDFVVVGNNILHLYKGNDTDVIIPSGIKIIGNYAFYHNLNIKSVTIPDSVSVIGDEVFCYCKNLESVNIPDSVTKIGYWAFYSCSALKEITIPDSVIEIGYRAFAYCSSLQTVNLPNGINRILKDTFYGCKSIHTITIPDSVTEIQDCAFQSCSSLESITIPDKVTVIGEEVFSGCSSLSEVIIPDSVTEIGKMAFFNCKAISSFKYLGKEQIVLKDFFGKKYPKGLIGDIFRLSEFMKDGAFKQYILTEEVWQGLSDEERFILVTTRQSKGLIAEYKKIITNAQAADIGGRIVNLLNDKPSAKQCGLAASFILEFNDKITTELAKKIYTLLSDCSNGKSAVKKLLQDQMLIHRLESDTTDDNNSNPIERFVAENWRSSKEVTDVLKSLEKGIAYADGSGVCSPEAAAFVIGAYTSQMDGTHKTISAYKTAYVKTHFDEAADKVAEALDKNELLELIKSKTSTNPEYLIPLCRFADSSEIAEVLSNMKIWSDWYSENGGRDGRKKIIIARGGLLLSDTREAMLYFDKQKQLDDYAKIRSTTADAIRDNFLSDVGLATDGTKVYDLGNQTVTAKMLPDLTFLITTSDGKVVKSLPKKGADEEKYNSANKDFSDMKKSIKKIAKSRYDVLFELFLNGNTKAATEWKDAYLVNPLLRQIASLLVWSQGKVSFTIVGDKAIDVNGNPYTIDDSTQIAVAHPMDMTASDIKNWQKYFTDNKLKQPFMQIWEPVTDVSTIKPDRYDNAEISFNYMRGAEKHGIILKDYDYYGDIEISMADCSCDFEFLNWGRHELPEKVKISNFKLEKLTRSNNHVIAQLDKWTIAQRIAKDDLSATEIISNATLAQLTYYMEVANENNAVNCMAALLELKNKNYPDFDPMNEYTLD